MTDLLRGPSLIIRGCLVFALVFAMGSLYIDTPANAQEQTPPEWALDGARVWLSERPPSSFPVDSVWMGPFYLRGDATVTPDTLISLMGGRSFIISPYPEDGLYCALYRKTDHVNLRQLEIIDDAVLADGSTGRAVADKHGYAVYRADGALAVWNEDLAYVAQTYRTASTRGFYIRNCITSAPATGTFTVTTYSDDDETTHVRIQVNQASPTAVDPLPVDATPGYAFPRSTGTVSPPLSTDAALSGCHHRLHRHRYRRDGGHGKRRRRRIRLSSWTARRTTMAR